jgi:ribonuclease R
MFAHPSSCANASIQSLYRVHEGPTPERLVKLRDFLAPSASSWGEAMPRRRSIMLKLLEQIGQRPDKQLLQTVMLRSLRQAIYSPDNVGHFGLAYESYTHFTSPIRRYPDLLVHRAIKSALATRRYEPGNWEEIGLHCSKTERRADEATRDVEDWLKCFYMKDRVGEIFEGSISSVVPFGIFVAFDGVSSSRAWCMFRNLGQDYFHFDEKTHSMVGERTGRRYRLSDRIFVQLVRVDMEASKIDFRLADATQRASSSLPGSLAGAVKPVIEKDQYKADKQIKVPDKKANGNRETAQKTLPKKLANKSPKASGRQSTAKPTAKPMKPMVGKKNKSKTKSKAVLR